MPAIRYPLLLALALTLVNCGSVSDILSPKNAFYCDNFLVYDMCVRDMNRDGIAEYIYFENSNEIFLYREGTTGRIPRNLTLHRCARQMEADLVATTSRMLFIDEDTSLLERTDIRGALLIKYMALVPEVTACSMAADNAGVASAPAD